MIKKLQFYVFLAVFASSLVSCSKSQKESAGNIGSSLDDATKYAVTKHGESVKIVFKGDMTGAKKEDALALVINKQFDDNRYWIQKGSVIEKDGNEWKTLLYMEEKLKTPKGEMIQQEEAKSGYIVSFKKEQSPMNLYISIADANGRPASDEATIKWNAKESVYEFSSGSESKPDKP